MTVSIPSYIGQETVFMSVNHIRNAIYKDVFNTASIHQSAPPKEKTQIKTKQTSSITSFKDDPSVMLAIQNNSSIMHFIVNCKGHKDLLAYIYVENSDNINFIVKNPNGFPLLLIKLPIDDVYVYTRTFNLCFAFPIKEMASKDIKYAKRNTYNILYKSGDDSDIFSSVQFVYEMFNTDNTVNTSYVLQNICVSSLTVINNLFKIAKADIKITDETQYLTAFQNMNVIVLRYIPDINVLLNMSNKTSARLSFSIELTSDKLNFISFTNRRRETKEIATCENSLLWKYSGPMIEYKLSSFENLFKANFNRIYACSDRVYYIFGTFLNIYVFIKFISPIMIKDNPSSTTLNQIFNGKYQFYECYYCLI
jgi:hypothetical protein